MPQAVIPFDLNSKTFFISILVSMAGSRLIFLLLQTLSGPTWGLITVCIKITGLNCMTPHLSTSEIYNMLALRRRQKRRERDPNDVEMGI